VTGPPSLLVEGLAFAYPDGHQALYGVDLRVERGERVALLGPNGAGKTTTVEICQGFRTPDAGSVRVLGQSPRDASLRPRIGVMPQTGGAYPGLR
jgi:ABC-2 type transport system ATP-binding protein